MENAAVLRNTRLSEDFYLIKVRHKNTAAMGQFYMLRAWGDFPVLSRPISVFDSDGESVSFLYKVVGEGTELIAALREGASLSLLGPLGRGFPLVEGRVAMVGGGVGIAPLYLAAKTIRAHSQKNLVDLYLGFSSASVLSREFSMVADRLTTDVGGIITDHIRPRDYDVIFTCGPIPMMRALYNKCKDYDVRLYVSMESRMACGIGACLGCSCPTIDGNRKVCKDGPVFEGREIFEFE